MSPPCSVTPTDDVANEHATTINKDEENNNNHDNEHQDQGNDVGSVVHVPLFSIRQGLACKVSPTSVAPWIKLSQTLDGRDKITKILQYTARLLAYFCSSSQDQFHLRTKLNAFKVSLTTSRKAYRLGRSLTELDKLRKMDSLWSLLLLVKTTKRSKSSTTTTQPPWWKTLGLAIKTIGLFGFWLGDNINFLTMSGVFDNYASERQQQLQERKSLQRKASHFANRSYFIGAIAGLFVNLQIYLLHRKQELKLAATTTTTRTKCSIICKDNNDDGATTTTMIERNFKKQQEKQFSLFMSLIKSCCDVIVFSNNPGIDLHVKYRGRKNNEILHCICGLLSASTVLYNNYPNK